MNLKEVTVSPFRLFSLKLNWISNHILWESKEVYKELQIPIESNWISVFSLLMVNGQMNVMELAKAAGVQHPSIINIVKKMKAKGLVEFLPNPEDSRSKLIQLTPNGISLFEQANPVWEVSEQIIESLTNIDDHTFMETIDDVIASLKKTPFSYRVLDKYKELIEMPS